MKRTPTLVRRASFVGLFVGLFVVLALSHFGCHRSSATSSAPRPPSSAAVELGQGALVPELPFVLQDGFKLHLQQLKGKLIVIYFCPALEQPDCAREMDGLRDRWNELQEKQHITIVGVSQEDLASQRTILAQHKLPFDLMSDFDGQMANAFGVPTAGPYAARIFFVGKDNRLRAVWRAANPEAHIAVILAAAGE